MSDQLSISAQFGKSALFVKSDLISDSLDLWDSSYCGTASVINTGGFSLSASISRSEYLMKSDAPPITFADRPSDDVAAILCVEGTQMVPSAILFWLTGYGSIRRDEGGMSQAKSLQDLHKPSAPLRPL
jgi:hypothetical protein